jgi:lipoate-protein ligase A
MGARKYIGVRFPAEYGGGGLDIMHAAIINEETAAQAYPLACLRSVPHYCAHLIYNFGARFPIPEVPLNCHRHEEISMASLRLLKTNYTYADFSTSISPAIEQALEEGKAVSTLVVNIFGEDSFTVGMQEDPEKSLDLDFCRQNGIVARRRQNPGGAVFGAKGSVMNCFYLDLGQPWVPFKSVREAFPYVLERWAAVIGEQFGIEARYRPLNDIEIEGRKLVATSARLENNIMTMRSLVNVAPTNREIMSKAVIAHPEKFQDKKAKEAGARFTCLQEEVGREIEKPEIYTLAQNKTASVFGPDVSLIAGELNSREQRYFNEFNSKFTSDEWFYGNSERYRFKDIPSDAQKIEVRHKAVAGLIRATILVRDNKIFDLILTGDIQPSPHTVLEDMEKVLRGEDFSMRNIKEQVSKVYNREEVEIAGTQLDDFTELFKKAINRI